MANVIFDYVSSSDLPTALEIEQLGQSIEIPRLPMGIINTSAGYPPDEAGTEASFRYSDCRIIACTH